MNLGANLRRLEKADPRFALVLQALAFWPTWRWYALRLGDSGEEAWGMAAILGAALVMFKGWGGGKRGSGSGAANAPEDRSGSAGRIGLAPVLATCLYAVTYPFLPPLPRAVLALAAMGCLLPSLGMGRPAILHGVGFLLLSLPVMPSLQFYLGYPLRVASGETAARLINLAGFPVVRDGTLLAWRDHAVFIDAPCSGVKMLWAGMVLALALSALRGHGARGTLAMGAAAFGAVVLGNVLRTTALFFLETGVVQGPAWAHSGVGVMAFLAAAGFITWVAGAIPRSGSQGGPCLLRCALTGERAGMGDKGVSPPAKPTEERYWSTATRSMTRAGRYLVYAHRSNPILLILAGAWAACLPFLDRKSPGPGAAGGRASARAVAWPTHWEGRALRPLPLTPEETKFAGSFPGALGRFTDGSAEILFRRVDSPTRKLHPSADCLRATGYAVKPRPAVSTAGGRTWSCHLATRGGETLLVREIVVAGNGDADAARSWTDISSWYWHALWGDGEGPWTAVTLSRRVAAAAP